MNNQTSSRNQSGFTLLQVMLAGSIGITLIYFFSSALVNFSKSGNRIAAKMDLVQLKAMVTESLSDPEVCTANFQGKRFTLATMEDGKIVNSIPISPPLDRIGMHRNPSDSTVIAYAGKASPGMTGEKVKELRLVQWRKLEDGLYVSDLEIVPLDTGAPLRSVFVRGIEFQFPKKSATVEKELLQCRKVGGLSDPPNQLVFPAVGGGGGFPKRTSAEIANMTCHHAFGPTFECELKEKFLTQSGEDQVWGGVYRCGIANQRTLCPSP